MGNKKERNKEKSLNVAGALHCSSIHIMCCHLNAQGCSICRSVLPCKGNLTEMKLFGDVVEQD